MFDLPTETPAQRRAYARFKDLLNDGFSMMQYSVYQRHCASLENAEVHIARMGACLPPEGEVRFLVITDKQYGKIRTYWGKKAAAGGEIARPARVFLSRTGDSRAISAPYTAEPMK
jgi:CRISPR-associated protein Cas2